MPLTSERITTQKLIYLYINNGYIPKWIYKLIALLLEKNPSFVVMIDVICPSPYFGLSSSFVSLSQLEL